MEIKTESQYTNVGEVSALEKSYLWPVVIVAGILWITLLLVSRILSFFINLLLFKRSRL